MAGCGSRKKYNRGGDVGAKSYSAGVNEELAGPAKKVLLKAMDKVTEKSNTMKRTKKEDEMYEKGKSDAKKAKEYKEREEAKKKRPKGSNLNAYKKGGMVKTHRGDGCAKRGKTKGRMV